MSTDAPAGKQPPASEELSGEAAACSHPAWRIFAWIAADGTLCAGCCDCGEVLAGEAQPLTNTDTGEV